MIRTEYIIYTIWNKQLHRSASITFQHPAFLQRHAVETWHVQAISMVTSDSNMVLQFQISNGYAAGMNLVDGRTHAEAL